MTSFLLLEKSRNRKERNLEKDDRSKGQHKDHRKASQDIFEWWDQKTPYVQRANLLFVNKFVEQTSSSFLRLYCESADNEFDVREVRQYFFESGLCLLLLFLFIYSPFQLFSSIFRFKSSFLSFIQIFS